MNNIKLFEEKLWNCTLFGRELNEGYRYLASRDAAEYKAVSSRLKRLHKKELSSRPVGLTFMVWTRSACPSLKLGGQKLTKVERKKIVNILLSFSAVTHTNNWRVNSALCNVVSLIPTKHFPIWETRNHERDELYAFEKLDSSDFWPLKLRKKNGRDYPTPFLRSWVKKNGFI